MFIRIGGIPGVGKSSIINTVSELSHDLKLPVERVKGGDYLLRLAGVATYDELRKLPEEYRASLRPDMYRLMYEDDRKDPSIIRLRDAHFSLLEEGQTKIVEFPNQVEDKYQLHNLVLVVADPETILARRKQDIGRSDRSLDIAKIEYEQLIEEEVAKRQASELQMELIIINNSGILNEVCWQLVHRSFPEGQLRRTLEGYLLPMTRLEINT